MTSNSVRVYLTEAIDRLFYDKGVRLPGEPKNVLAAEVLAVVETLRTPCPDCAGEGDDYSPLQNGEDENCPTCDGTGQSALLAFDEMRAADAVAFDEDGNEYPQVLR